MKIKDVMTPAPKCVAPETSLREAARQMKEHDVGVLPVCSEDRLAGMITDRDIALRAVAESCDADTTTVGEVMTPHAIYCFEDDELGTAVERMEDRQIRRLAVLNSSKRLVGIVSLGDLATRVRDDRLSGEVLERISEPSAVPGI